MKKLIQTNFQYRYNTDSRTHSGSYLGRKAATETTLRRFLLKNAGDNGFKDWRVVELSIVSSFESRWIHK